MQTNTVVIDLVHQLFTWMESLSLQFSGRYSRETSDCICESYHVKQFLSYLNNYLLRGKETRGFLTIHSFLLYSERFHSISHLVWWLKAHRLWSLKPAGYEFHSNSASFWLMTSHRILTWCLAYMIKIQMVTRPIDRVIRFQWDD